MRRLNNQPAPGGISPIAITAVDTPGYGEPTRRYELTGFNTVYNPAAVVPGQRVPSQFSSLPIFFHEQAAGRNGPANGVTENSLLAVIADRLQSLQTGPQRCLENDAAIQNIIQAMQLLERRDAAPMFPPIAAPQGQYAY